MSNSIRELEDSPFIFAIGTNTTESHPVIALRIKKAVKKTLVKKKAVKKKAVKKKAAPKVSIKKKKVAVKKPIAKKKPVLQKPIKEKKTVVAKAGVVPELPVKKAVAKKAPAPPKIRTITVSTFKKTFVTDKSIANNPPPPVTKTNKKQYKIEFEMKASPRSIYNYLSTPSGLSAWFADNVTSRDGIITFQWNGSEERAKLIGSKENQMLRYQWLENEKENTYFQFDIVLDDITSDVALVVTDFAADDRERDANTLLWNSQVHALMQTLGLH